MDAGRFDDLSRMLAAVVSRRGLAAAALGAVLGAIGVGGPAGAGKKKKPLRCSPACGACRRCVCAVPGSGKTCRLRTCEPVANGTRCRGGTCLGGRCATIQNPPSCSTLRQPCGSGCCDGLVCGDTGCGDFVCHQPLGGPCDDDCDCSQILTNCSAVTGTCRSCVFPLEPCVEADDCCLGDICGTSSTGAEKVCCFVEGSLNCISSDECCAGLFCDIDAQGFGECKRAPR